VSDPEVPSRPWTPKGPPKARTALLEFRPLRHSPTQQVRITRGLHGPGTFRPQGLITLSTVCSLSHLAPARQPARRPWGFTFKALLLPASGTLLRASPLLSFPRSRFRGNGCDFRGYLRPERGTKAAARVRDRRTLPSWVFAPSGLSPAYRLRTGFPAQAPLALLTGSAPYVSTSGQGPRGFERRSRLVSLKTGCPLGVSHLPA